MIKRHKLRAGDPAQRLAFSTRLVNTVAQNPGFLDQLAVSDEAVFSLNSELNTRNVIHCAPYRQGHPLNHFVEFEQSADSIMVWSGLTRAGVLLGPHFIQGNLNTREYLRIIRYHVIQRGFPRNDINRQVMWWQQDGAPAQTSNVTLQYLTGQFPGRIMSKRGDWPWPPRSPNLAVHDFFLWGYMKIWDVPHNQQPQTLRALRAAIVQACNNLQQQMIRNVFDGMLTRAMRWINSRGHALKINK